MMKRENIFTPRELGEWDRLYFQMKQERLIKTGRGKKPNDQQIKAQEPFAQEACRVPLISKHSSPARNGT